MTDVQKQESQKTVVSFIFGLLIGGLLVWSFMGGEGDTKNKEHENKNEAENTETTNNDTVKTEDITTQTNSTDSSITIGEGKVTLGKVTAGKSVKIDSVTYPIEEGWIGVREYTDGKLGYINGVIRFSKAGNVSPSEIPLVTATRSGRDYAVVIFTEGGDKSFNSATDRQLDTIFATFKAE